MSCRPADDPQRDVSSWFAFACSLPDDQSTPAFTNQPLLGTVNAEQQTRISAGPTLLSTAPICGVQIVVSDWMHTSSRILMNWMLLSTQQTLSSSTAHSPDLRQNFKFLEIHWEAHLRGCCAGGWGQEGRACKPYKQQRLALPHVQVPDDGGPQPAVK